MTTIKRMNGFMETTHVEGNKVIYKRLRTNTPVQEEVKHEIVTTDNMTEDEWKEAVMKEIMDRVAIKKEEYRQEQARKEQIEKTMYVINKLCKEERRKMRPRTTAHRLMDAIGIDRRKVYDILCNLEQRMN